MSTQAVNQFLQKVSEDSQLQQELAVALEGENNSQAVIDLAVKHGYKFTPDEFWTEIENRQSKFQQSQDSGDLNEEELEAVAGGFCWNKVQVPQFSAGICLPMLPKRKR